MLKTKFGVVALATSALLATGCSSSDDDKKEQVKKIIEGAAAKKILDESSIPTVPSNGEITGVYLVVGTGEVKDSWKDTEGGNVTNQGASTLDAIGSMIVHVKHDDATNSIEVTQCGSDPLTATYNSSEKSAEFSKTSGTPPADGENGYSEKTTLNVSFEDDGKTTRLSGNFTYEERDNATEEGVFLQEKEEAAITWLGVKIANDAAPDDYSLPNSSVKVTEYKDINGNAVTVDDSLRISCFEAYRVKGNFQGTGDDPKTFSGKKNDKSFMLVAHDDVNNSKFEFEIEELTESFNGSMANGDEFKGETDENEFSSRYTSSAVAGEVLEAESTKITFTNTSGTTKPGDENDTLGTLVQTVTNDGTAASANVQAASAAGNPSIKLDVSVSL